MDLLNGVLDRIECTGFRNLHLVGEARGQILLDDSVRAGEESENAANEVLFVGGQLVPVPPILRQIDLFRYPHGALMLLVHIVELGIMNREEGESMRIWLKNGLRDLGRT